MFAMPMILVFIEWLVGCVCSYMPRWLDQYFHIYIHMPIFDFLYKHTEMKWINIPYKFAHDTFKKELEDLVEFEENNEEEKGIIKDNKARACHLYNDYMRTYKRLGRLGPKYENEANNENGKII